MTEQGICDRCGESIDTHPTIDVRHIDQVGLCQVRSMKWQRVEPGTVIPAGQPYRVETPDEIGCTATEYLRDEPWLAAENGRQWFVDSSWKPPLVLPTEPTWGIAVYKNSGCHPAQMPGLWSVVGGQWIETSGNTFRVPMSAVVLDFIPLTDEQVARIEAAR